MENRKAFIAGVIVVIICIALYFYISTHSVFSTNPASMAPVSYTPPVADAAPAGSHTYTNAQFQFSLQYPQDLTVKDRAEAGGAHTITFEGADGQQGFQIFIRPYTETQITASQINIDTHGSATGTPQEVVIGDEIHALLFQSKDPVLGDLREVWFVHGGYIFEVTTYLELDTWLASILRSMQFTG